MPKPAKGPRLGGSSSHERLMLANLACSLFEHKAITTTEHRAKRVQPLAEKMISKAKRGDLHARRTVLANLRRKDIVAELFEELAPQFAGRDGGYTRITKIANRKGDNAPMVILELVLEPVKAKKAAPKKAEPAKAAPKKAAEPAEEPAETVEVEVEDSTAEIRPLYAGAVRVEATADAPDAEHAIKGNEDSMKYHVPGSQWYDATIAEVWFATAEDAKAAGFEPAGGEDKQDVEA